MTVLLLWTYGVLAGAQMPVMRAVIMATIAIVAMALERRVEPGNTIGLASLFILAYHPHALFEPGFQLTFISVGLILLAALPLSKKLEMIGKWRPRVGEPCPPLCGKAMRWTAELLYWSEKSFKREMADSPTKYRLDKNIWTGRLEKIYLQPPLRALFLILMTSVIVWLGLLPLSALYFNRISLIGILLNIAAELLMSALLASTVLFFLLDYYSSWAGSLAAKGVEAIAALFIFSASPFEIPSWSSFRLGNYTGWRSTLYALYYLPVLFYIISLNRWQPLSKPGSTELKEPGRRFLLSKTVTAVYLAVSISILSPGLLGTGARPESKGRLELVFLDVGQGDAALILFPGGKTMMVDGGGSFLFPTSGSGREEAIVEDLPSIGEQVVSRYLWWRGIDKLDYLVATHAHSDHIEGLGDLLKNFKTGRAVVSALPLADSQFDRFALQARKAGVPLVVWQGGDRFVLDGVVLEVLWPPADRGAPSRLDNNQSMVLRLSYGAHSILLSGDIEQQAEWGLISSGVDLASNILKAPHHGSKTSSTIPFLERVSPEIAIISAPSRSRFGHPHKEVLERYCGKGIVIYQTGLSGAITVSTDGKELKVEPFSGGERSCP
jgi:competence protein ComEC